MSGNRKRLFLALWPDQETADAILRGTRTAVAECGGRAVSPQNLHITLAFLHAVETALIPCIEQAALRAATGSFDLLLDRVGYWQRSRILWLAPAREAAAAPCALADALWRELANCGFTPEQRRYRPHVTLARKGKHPVFDTLMPPVRWRAESFCLVESITGQRRSEYVVRKTFPLA